MKLHYIPLENLKERYTEHMNDELYQHMDYIYYPENYELKQIKKGEFLDVERTIEFKAKQIELISKAFQKGKVKTGDVFLFADIFFPGIESVKYMAELQDIEIKIAGFNYAGRADINDFVRKLNNWSDIAELSYHSVCDLVLFGSEYHRNLVVNYFNIDQNKTSVTGLVWNEKKAFNVYPYYEEKEDFIVFPHRVSKEKGIDDLINYSKLTNKKIIITSSGNKKLDIELPSNIEYINNLTKKDYYKILSRAKYYLSCAKQETFGYTLQEALMYNCIVACPNDVAYVEQLHKSSLYDDIKEINDIFNRGLIAESKHKNTTDKIIKTIKDKLC